MEFQLRELNAQPMGLESIALPLSQAFIIKIIFPTISIARFSKDQICSQIDQHYIIKCTTLLKLQSIIKIILNYLTLQNKIKNKKIEDYAN
ncbi:hypothetical protein pb186bvf_015731 [Paramecium bursaria]